MTPNHSPPARPHARHRHIALFCSHRHIATSHVHGGSPGMFPLFLNARLRTFLCSPYVKPRCLLSGTAPWCYSRPKIFRKHKMHAHQHELKMKRQEMISHGSPRPRSPTPSNLNVVQIAVIGLAKFFPFKRPLSVPDFICEIPKLNLGA